MASCPQLYMPRQATALQHHCPNFSLLSCVRNHCCTSLTQLLLFVNRMHGRRVVGCSHLAKELTVGAFCRVL